jgi:hypothetical protein
MQGCFLRNNPNYPVVCKFFIPAEYQRPDSLRFFDLFHPKVRKYFTRRRIPRGFALVGKEVFARLSNALPDNMPEKCMLDTLRLNSATKHQICHPRLPDVNNAEADNPIRPEQVLAAEDVGIQMRSRQYAF